MLSSELLKLEAKSLQELNTLISGSTAGFDVKDLRANTVLSGGYQARFQMGLLSAMHVLSAVLYVPRTTAHAWFGFGSSCQGLRTEVLAAESDVFVHPDVKSSSV